MSTKIALDAGHWYYEAGRRCLKKFDPNETREWILNSRIVERVQFKLKAYEDVEVLRVDDPTGRSFIDVNPRANIANMWGADIYCSFHHNAGVNGGSGGGITIMTYDAREKLVELRDILYACLLNAGGIKGNRRTPKYNRPGLAVLRETNMSAVLVEHGFMDSSVDVPIIITEEYAEKMANGWIDFFEQYLGIKKKAVVETPTVEPTPSTPNTPTTIEVDDTVSIAKGATYYSGKTIPAWVLKKNWLVASVKGDRVVIDKSSDGKNSINSPVSAKYLTVVSKETNSSSTATPAPVPAPTVTQEPQYYPKYTGKSNSLDTILATVGVPAKYRGSWEKRVPVATANGISGYEGTGKQNSTLKSLAKKGKLKKV